MKIWLFCCPIFKAFDTSPSLMTIFFCTFMFWYSCLMGRSEYVLVADWYWARSVLYLLIVMFIWSEISFGRNPCLLAMPRNTISPTS